MFTCCFLLNRSLTDINFLTDLYPVDPDLDQTLKKIRIQPLRKTGSDFLEKKPKCESIKNRTPYFKTGSGTNAQIRMINFAKT